MIGYIKGREVYMDIDSLYFQQHYIKASIHSKGLNLSALYV